MTVESVRQLPREEKLRLLEALWEALSSSEEDYTSPAWHQQELAEAERRLAAGEVHIVDWDKAKEQLREGSK